MARKRAPNYNGMAARFRAIVDHLCPQCPRGFAGRTQPGPDCPPDCPAVRLHDTAEEIIAGAVPLRRNLIRRPR